MDERSEGAVFERLAEQIRIAPSVPDARWAAVSNPRRTESGACRGGAAAATPQKEQDWP